MRVAILAALTLSLLACERDKKDVDASAATAAQDALWALAPAGSEVGFVLTPHAFVMLDLARQRVEHALETAPELAGVKKQLDDMLIKAFNTPLLYPGTRGFTLQKGFAFFATSSGKVVVLPVADRDTFLLAMKGVKGAAAVGMMAAIAIPAFTEYMERSKAAARAREP